MLQTFTGNNGRPVTSQEWLTAVNAASGVTYIKTDILFINRATLDYISMVKTEVSNAQLNLQLAWTVIRILVPFSHSEYTLNYKAHQAACLNLVYSIMKTTIASAFFSRRLSVTVLERARSIALDIRDALASQVNSSSNILDKDAVLEKLANMKFIIGLPDGFRTDDDLNRFWAGAPDASRHFVKAWLSTRRYYVSQLLTRPNLALFPMFTLRAYYDSTNVRVFASPSILTLTFFTGSGDSAMDYGGFGHLIGTAMAQVAGPVTTTGRCPPGGAEMLVGLQGAYLAYTRKYRSKNSQRLPLLGVPPKQLFFAAACVKLCQVRMLTGESEGQDCNDLVSNIEGFKDTFKCDSGSAMHARQKCFAW